MDSQEQVLVVERTVVEKIGLINGLMFEVEK